jgi:hypothetical protein
MSEPFVFSNKQRRPAGLHTAVRELGDLKNRVDFEGDALQLATLF